MEEENQLLEGAKAVGGGALWGLQKYGEGIDWTNDQVNLRNALRINKGITDRIPGQWDEKILDYSYKDARDDISGGAGWAAEKLTGSKAVGQGVELAGQVLLPDAIDFATGGVGYLDNLARVPGALKKISTKDGARIIEDVFSRSRFKAGQIYRSAEEGVQAVTDAVTSPIRTIKGAFEGVDAGTGGARAMSGSGLGGGGSRYVQGELPLQRVQSIGYKEKVANYMNNFGMPDGVFDLRTYDLRKTLKTETQRRIFLEHYLSPDFIKGRFSGFDKANRPEFAAKWADFLTAKGLHPVGDVQIHHINPLYDSVHLFDGVKFDSDEYWNIIETLIDGNARTGVIHRGEAVQNLMMTLGKGKIADTPHGIAHKYLNSQTPTFFSKAELDLMKADPAYRIQKANDWAVIVNKAEQTILEAHKQWSLLNPKTAANLSFDELVDTLSEYTDTGYSKLLDPEFQLPDFNRIITQIANDKGLKGPIFQQLPKPVDLSKVTKWEKIRKEQEIADELRNMRKPKKPVNPDQTELDL